MPQYGKMLFLNYFPSILYKVPHIHFMFLIAFCIFYLLTMANTYLLTEF